MCCLIGWSCPSDREESLRYKYMVKLIFFGVIPDISLRVKHSYSTQCDILLTYRCITTASTWCNRLELSVT